MTHGVKIEAWITNEIPVDIDSSKFLDEFLEWIEAKGYQCTGSFCDYRYKHIDEDVNPNPMESSHLL